jgi:amidohydrolase
MHPTLAAATALQSTLLDFRRSLHRNPELSFQEHKTCAFVQARLAEMGIESRVVAGTGVVAHIGAGANTSANSGGNSGGNAGASQTATRCVALRADIDALPIHEESGVEFASQNAGVMHACGHDAHTAMLLGAAKILKERESTLAAAGAVVKLLFQPGEEMNPGGASLMIRDGVLEHGFMGCPRPEVIFGQHVNPDANTGVVGFVGGTMMASTDELFWTVHGKSGHAAQPHRSGDAVLMAATLVTSLQALIARTLNPLESGVLSITRIQGGAATNVIPDTVEMAGTLRSMNLEWREWAVAAIEEHSTRLCASPLYSPSAVAAGSTDSALSSFTSCTFRRDKGYPPLVNNASTTAFALKAASNLVGSAACEAFEPKMWGEDFAFYTHHVPGTFWMLGVRPPDRTAIPGLHNAKFILDEAALPVGTALLANAALERLLG